MDFEKRLSELFIELSETPKSVKAEAPAVLAGKFLHVGGCLPFAEGKVSFKGRLGLELNADQGAMAARHAVIQALSAVRQSLGSLNKVKQIVQLNGYVACGGDFKDHEKVFDSASRLLQEIFSMAGKHTRVVVGVHSLPQNACVEISLLVETK